MNKNYLTYNDLFSDSIQNKEEFWKDKAQLVDWVKFPKQILNFEKAPFYRWYNDGVINITSNCLDRHVAKFPDKVAYIYEGPIAKETKQITYRELLNQVELFSGVLVSKGLTKGDRVIVYMPMILETIVAMLACARIGAIHSVVFGGFSSQELASRIQDCHPKLIVSASCGLEPHKILQYPLFIRESLEISNQFNIPVIYVNRKQSLICDLKENEFLWEDEMKKAQPQNAIDLESNHPLYILYTSGTTGKPKGIYRGTGDTAVGIMVSLEYGFGFSKDTIHFATSDFGWVVGHSYMVYGPLLFGATTIIYEGKPVGTPDVGAYFNIVQKYKVNILYSSPTAIRAIRRDDPEAKIISKYDLSSLKVMGMVGERTDIHTYNYLAKIIPKDCLYNDTYWQTETGWFICANFMTPERFQTQGGTCTKPFPGYEVHIFTEDKSKIDKPNVLGHVIIKLPMPPGFMLSLWNNDDYCKEKYFQEFPEYYQTGDAGFFDKNGYLNVMTRTDDVIQVAGHRLSTSQMEESVLTHKDVAEAVVVGVDDALKGQLPYALLVLKKGVKRENEQELFKEIVLIVRKIIGPVACLHNFSIVTKLPKTRSGKILRGTIRKILDKMPYETPATIEDPTSLDEIQYIADNILIKRDHLEFTQVDELELKKFKLDQQIFIKDNLKQNYKQCQTKNLKSYQISQ